MPHLRPNHLLLSLPLCMLAGGLGAQTVLNATDLASLRTHLASANGGTGDYVINIAAGTYTLDGGAGNSNPASGDLDITRATAGNIALIGTGAATIIDGDDIDRVFHVNAGSPNVTVTFQNMTIRNGRAVDWGASTSESLGGGIYVQSNTSVTLNNVVLSGNEARGETGSAAGTTPTSGGGGQVGGNGRNGRGGAIYMAGGTLTLQFCSLTGNQVFGGQGGTGGRGPDQAGTTGVIGGAGGAGGLGGDGAGGAIFVAAGTLNLLSSTVSGGNSLGGQGGDGGRGGDASGGNTPNGGQGGGGGTGGFGLGGAIFIQAGTMVITNSTVSGATMQGGTGGTGGRGGDATGANPPRPGRGGNGGGGGQGGECRGGGLYQDAGTVTINNSTVAANAANSGANGAAGAVGTGTGASGSTIGTGIIILSAGGGYYQFGGTLTVRSSIFADNNAGQGAEGNAAMVATNSLFESSMFIIFSGGSGSNVTGVDPQLSALANTGGPTQTHALSATSPALNVGANPTSLTTDQRGTGHLRSSGSGVDMGSYELQVANVAPPTVTDPASALTTGASTYNIQGSAPANSLVRIYRDSNNNGVVDGTETVVASQQLSGGGTAFSVSTPLTAAAVNNFLATAFNGTLESPATDVPTITQATLSAAPVVTSPAAVTTVNAASFNIQGTAPANSLVRIYSDANNDGVVNGADAVVASQQLTGGGASFAIAAPLAQNANNDFIAKAFNGSAESTGTDVPRIIEDSAAPAAPVVTAPATAISITGASYNIQGTAEANALVRIYRDLNANGVLDSSEPLVSQAQLTGGGTGWSIGTTLTASSVNEFVVTATDAAGNESAAANVPTITESSVTPPTITTPAAPIAVNQPTFDIQGTAPANSLVRIYSDFNNDGLINGTDAAIGTQQLTGGGTTFSITVTLAQNSANNFTATASNAVPTESSPVNVPTITDNSGVSGGSGGGGGHGGGCSTQDATGPWMLALGAIGALLLALQGFFTRKA